MSICKICGESWKQLSQLIMGHFLVNTVKSYHLKFKIEVYQQVLSAATLLY